MPHVVARFFTDELVLVKFEWSLQNVPGLASMQPR